jgi:hypothetical protein
LFCNVVIVVMYVCEYITERTVISSGRVKWVIVRIGKKLGRIECNVENKL